MYYFLNYKAWILYIFYIFTLKIQANDIMFAICNKW